MTLQIPLKLSPGCLSSEKACGGGGGWIKQSVDLRNRDGFLNIFAHPYNKGIKSTIVILESHSLTKKFLAKHRTKWDLPTFLNVAM